MSNQNRFLLPHSSTTTTTTTSASSSRSAVSSSNSSNALVEQQQQQQHQSQDLTVETNAEQENNQHSVDTDFDSYWEEEARNPHRNRIRIGRQYQASVPPLIKTGEKDRRKLDELETLSFCPKKSARLSDAELDHYFTVAKSLNLFASLVETRSLLGRDVTIADLNHIRNKEGLSLASVIQPVRQAALAVTHSNSNVLPLSSQQSANNQQQTTNTTTTTTTTPTTTSSTLQQQQQQVNQQHSPQKSPLANYDRSLSSSSSSPKELTVSNNAYAFNQPLMRALSHFINLHHSHEHKPECKKLLKNIPLENDSASGVSMTIGNLRQGSSSSSVAQKEFKPGRSRSSLKQQAAVAQVVAKEEPPKEDQDDHQVSGDSISSPSQDDWTREEVELFSKAIEVLGKNFSLIKKEFLPSKSVTSIVEYYYIGSRDSSENKKKAYQTVETGDGCSSPEKSIANNNSQGGGGNTGPSASGKTGSSSSHLNSATSSSNTNSSSRSTNSSNSDPNNPNKSLSDTNQNVEQTYPTLQEYATSKSKSLIKSESNQSDLNGTKIKTKNIDARMSVYNFDEEFKDDSPIRIDCPRPGAEVKPLKAKPIIPNASNESDATNSNVGSLKFFMDGQLVLKLNACQEQQEGVEKCHWVQSGDKVVTTSKQKRYSKKSDRSSTDYNQNGSQSNSVVSSYQDDDSKNDDLTADEDSKESMNSFSNLPQQQQKNQQHKSPTSKRLKIKNDSTSPQQGQLPSPINYNRLAVNNRIKERSDSLNSSPVVNQAMPWLQANSFAVAAALLGGLPFPQNPAANIIDTSQQQNVNLVNMSSKPMDLSLEHSTPKAIQKSSSRSRSRPKNN